MATEFVAFRHKVYVASAALCMNGLLMPITAFYFKFISQDWRWMFYFWTGITTIITLLAHLVPESPRYLYEKQKYAEAKYVVNRMVHLNSDPSLIPGSWIFDKEDVARSTINNINKSYTSSNITVSKSSVSLEYREKSLKESIEVVSIKFPNSCHIIL